MTRRLVLAVAVLAVIAACSTDTIDQTTTLALDDPWDSIIEVTFDGEGCSVSGPAAVPARAGQAVVMTNNSDIAARARVASIEGGATFDDLVRMQGVDFEAWPGSVEGYYRPYEEHYSFAPEHFPEVDLADNQRLDAWLLTYGQDLIFVSTSDRDWFCAPLEVTAIEF